MTSKPDLSIFSQFNFEYSPVGVKFEFFKPKYISPLSKKLAFCEMLKEAQSGTAFFADSDNHECGAGLIPLGLDAKDPLFESGHVGPKLGVFDDARANRNVYTQLFKLAKDSVNYVSFAPLEKINFDPDLLIVTAKPSQAEIILRAKSYRTGIGWNAKGTTVIGCASLYAYPYVSGEVNMMVTGLHHGMKARELFPEGLLFLSIPYQILPEVTHNLSEMEWDLPQYRTGKEAHIERMKRIVGDLKAELD